MADAAITNSHVVLDSPHLGQALTLPQGTVTVGRAVGCLLVINDPGVSRKHLQFHVGRQVIVEDLGSENGTWINGQRISGRRALADGDKITVGGRSFTLRIVEDYADDCPTATGETRGTMLGVGAVMQRACHQCGCDLPLYAELCPRCGQTWRSSEAKSNTEENAEVSAETASRHLRRHVRYPVSLPVRYVSGTLSTEGTASDISLGGAFINTAQIDAVGTSCTLLMAAPETARGKGSEVLIRGFVRNAIHRGRPGMGIEFASLDAKQRHWLEALLAKTKPA